MNSTSPRRRISYAPFLGGIRIYIHFSVSVSLHLHLYIYVCVYLFFLATHNSSQEVLTNHCHCSCVFGNVHVYVCVLITSSKKPHEFFLFDQVIYCHSIDIYISVRVSVIMNCLASWPEPVVRVQHLSDSGMRVIPERYVKKPLDRPGAAERVARDEVGIPVVDMKDLYSGDASLRRKTALLIDIACREWGFFQVVNHGVSHELMARTREAWHQFFHLPLEEKQKYANSPRTYEGYGSRLGVEKGVSLDWSDYFFLHFLPLRMRDHDKWPSLPVSCRQLVDEYSRQVVELGGKLMKVFSTNLGLREEYLQDALGGDDEIGACLRANYYPKCPQPDLTLGLSPHSDPGTMTLLFPDEDVSGLQVRHAGKWVTVKPLPNAFIVNLADQLQIMSNGNYKSVEHRVIVNANKERVSLAYFYNPKGDTVIKPAEPLVSKEHPALYPPMTFDEYRLYVRTKGLHGKSQVESLAKSPKQ